MKKRPDLISIHDIVRAAKLGQSFVKGISKNEFLDDLKTQAAVCRQLEIIGEASTRLSVEFRKANPTVQWRQIIGMRNILIHLYEEVDSEDLWGTVTDDLPKLIAALELLVSKS